MAASLLVLLKLAVLAGLAKILYTIIYNLHISPLKHYPGPLLYRATSIPYDLVVLRGGGIPALRRLHEKYGPVVRVRPNELSFIDHSLWKDAYGFRQGHKEFPKTDKITRPNGVNGILGSLPHNHRRFRRLMAHAFSAQGLRDQEPRVRYHVNQLVARLGERCSSSYSGSDSDSDSAHAKVVDMVEWLSFTTVDIIGDLAFGKPFGCLESEYLHPWMDFVTKMMRPSLYIAMLRRWGLGSQLLLSWLLPRSAARDMKENFEFVGHRIRDRVHMGKERGDFFDYILKHGLIEDEDEKEQKPEEEKGIRLTELDSIANDLALAGSETSATVLSGIFFHLVRTPNVLQQLTDEIRSIFPTSDTMTADSLSQLPYLDAVLQEGLRIHHPVPQLAGRVVPETGETVAGVAFPAGTRLIISPFVAFTSAHNFARPLEFVPERWLNHAGSESESESESNEFATDNPGLVFQPFGYGPRNCIGMNLARAEMRMILALLIWHFDFRLPPMKTLEEEREWDSWVERQKVWFLWVKGPLLVEVSKRLNPSGTSQPVV